MNKIVIAPDSYKGNLTAFEVCEIVAQAAFSVFPAAQVVKMPLSDGGEGLVDAMLAAKGGERVRVRAHDPLMRPADADYAILPDGTAVIEMAAASGLPLVPRELRNPLNTTTYGTGELLRDALDRGVKNILLGLGGSATNDGGIGAAAALGIRFLAEDGSVCLTGGDLCRIVSVNAEGMHPALREAHSILATDVTNPLCGANGAAHIFGPQKGANADDIRRLDVGLCALADLLQPLAQKNLLTTRGLGAAGGLALPFFVFSSARIQSGLDLVLDAMNFDAHLDADLIITGEGRTDAQSAMGKVVGGVARRAREVGVPVAVLSGTLDDDLSAIYEAGVTAAFATCRKIQTKEQAMECGAASLRRAALDLFRLLRAVALRANNA